MDAGNFGELNEIVFILKHMCSSDNLTKLCHFIKSNDPLNETLPVGVDNYELLMYDHLYPYLKIIDINEEGASVYVNVYFGRSVNRDGTSMYKQNFLFVDVFAHQSLWKIDTGIRTYSILQEIDTKLNQKKIDKVTEMFSFVDFRALPSPNPKYAGFCLTYQKTDSGVKCIDEWED